VKRPPPHWRAPARARAVGVREPHRPPGSPGSRNSLRRTLPRSYINAAELIVSAWPEDTRTCFGHKTPGTKNRAQNEKRRFREAELAADKARLESGTEGGRGAADSGNRLQVFDQHQAVATCRFCWKHSRQNTGRPCVGLKGTVVSLPHSEQVVRVSTLANPLPAPEGAAPSTDTRLVLQALQRLGSFLNCLSWKNNCSPAVKIKSALQSMHFNTLS
jgi:hypothetical protein